MKSHTSEVLCGLWVKHIKHEFALFNFYFSNLDMIVWSSDFSNRFLFRSTVIVLSFCDIQTPVSDANYNLYVSLVSSRRAGVCVSERSRAAAVSCCITTVSAALGASQQSAVLRLVSELGGWESQLCGHPCHTGPLPLPVHWKWLPTDYGHLSCQAEDQPSVSNSNQLHPASDKCHTHNTIYGQAGIWTPHICRNRNAPRRV